MECVSAACCPCDRYCGIVISDGWSPPYTILLVQVALRAIVKPSPKSNAIA
jgi:hypothetical protein